MNKRSRGLVITDNPELSRFAIELSKELSLDLEFRFTREARTGFLMEQLGATKINFYDPNLHLDAFLDFDFILSIHCSQIFPERIFSNIPCYNLHPGFNPHNRGWFPQVFSIINGKPIGATLHRISSLIDGGPVIKQYEVKVSHSDTSLELYEKIIEVEKKLLFEYLPLLFSADYEEVTFEIPFGNYNSKSDFDKICHLELDSMGTLKEHLELLRALSHGRLDNAYFFDESGAKIYVSLNLRKSENQ